MGQKSIKRTRQRDRGGTPGRAISSLHELIQVYMTFIKVNLSRSSLTRSRSSLTRSRSSLTSKVKVNFNKVKVKFNKVKVKFKGHFKFKKSSPKRILYNFTSSPTLPPHPPPQTYTNTLINT